MKTEMNGRVADQLRDQGPSGLLGRKCEGMHNIPVWGTLRANNPKAPTMVKGDGIEVRCSGGMATEVVLRKGFDGKLPKGTAWGMKWKEVYKTLKKAGLKDRIAKDKKSADGPYVKLRGQGSGASVVWRWSDSKGKTPVDTITFAKN